MLSLILSGIFRVGFVLAILGGTIAVVNQLTNRRLAIPFNEGSQISFGQGLEVNATGYNQKALSADTVIKFVCRDSNNNIIGSGEEPLHAQTGSTFTKRISQILGSRKASGDRCRIDTFYTVMGQAIPGEQSSPEYQIDETAGAKRAFQPDSGIISRHPLVFADASSAKRYFLLRSFSYSNKISEDAYLTKTLKIRPSNKWQQVSFAVHELVKFASISFLFLFLSRLFRNFSKQRFFTPGNIRLLRNTGFLMLVPPFATVLLYFFVLRHLTPVKYEMDQNAEVSSLIRYNVTPDVNWILITIAVSLLVLPYIFRDGHELKEAKLRTA